jgi:ABC-2 type transport system permease protein
VTPVPSRLDRAPTRIVSSRTSVAQHLRDIWTYRELLRGLVRKELQVKYKNSVVGVGWSMVNPAMTLAVFYFVFQIVLKNGIPDFAIYLLCGLLVWNLFSTALPSATGAVVGNAAIVKKVAFPREILALASVGASLQFFFYQAIVMVLALVVFRFVPSFSYMPLLVPALLALLMFAAALGIFLAAMNVYFRDIQHLLEVVMTAWFWATPIVYTYRNIADRLGPNAWVFRLNPITPIVLTFQRALYNKISPRSTTGSGPVAILPAHVGRLWYLAQLLGVMAGSVVLFLAAVAVFARLEGNFAEEL